jgi:hypothetical protein
MNSTDTALWGFSRLTALSALLRIAALLTPTVPQTRRGPAKLRQA